jgi:4-amino-4-deoxy-L-arabinose transferase-like glycosyltransferase
MLFWLGLLGLTMVRMFVAATSPMAPDEAYYWVWSRALAPGYLDHPPMVALWIRAGTSLLGETALGVRFLAPFSAALGTFLLVRAGDMLLPGRHAGFAAGVLMNASLLFAVGTTTLTPDTPLLLFWTATLWALAKLLTSGDGRWWLVAGLAAGLALDSKYTGILLAPAILAWVVLVPRMRVWLRRWIFWASAVVAALLFSPVLWWNAEHGFASFAKQGGRAASWDIARAGQYLLELVGGQIGLATPGVAVLCAAGMVLSGRGLRRGDPALGLLAVLSLVPALVFVQHALGDRVQANWPAIIYPAAAIAAAGLAGRWRERLRPAALLGFLLTALVWTQAIWSPLALPIQADPTLLRLGGWQKLADDVAARARAEGAHFVAADNYGQAALLARLLPPDIAVLGAEARWALFALPTAAPGIAGRLGLLLRSARRDDAPDRRYWNDITSLPPLTRTRDGMTAEGFRLYRVTGSTMPPEAGTAIAVMPRPGIFDQEPLHVRTLP